MEYQSKITQLLDNLSKVIVGKPLQMKLIVAALLTGGHVLIEDMPGTGKTMLAKSLSKSIRGKFNRIQFTPDLLPSDVTGINYFNPKDLEFVFREGPAFCNILLADEINRATPRTQSSLLECMEEHQITVDGTTYVLEEPFFVIATQNPIETSGTFPLPEAQLDRFVMKIEMGTPTREEELQILNRFLQHEPLEELEPVLSTNEIVTLSKKVKEVYLHEALQKYIIEIIQKTRESKDVAAGVSPRGTLALANAAKAFALIEGRTFVIPEDVKSLLTPVLSHRIVIHRGKFGIDKSNQVLLDIIQDAVLPTEEWGS